MYLGTIIAKVRFKLRPSGLNKNEYLLPVEIISASKEDGYYYKGQIVDLIIKPRRSKFTEVSLVEIKYFKDKKWPFKENPEINLNKSIYIIMLHLFISGIIVTIGIFSSKIIYDKNKPKPNWKRKH